jgi:hypothetical protein
VFIESTPNGESQVEAQKEGAKVFDFANADARDVAQRRPTEQRIRYD